MRRRPWGVAVLVGVMSAGWGGMRAQDKTRDTGPPAGRELIDWVPISSGTFLMGAEDAGLEERPVHRVAMPAFEIARTPVTFKQYSACVAAGACLPVHDCAPALFLGPEQPVVCVDWPQAKAFSEWVGGRLPTEAEWEYAARSGGKERQYPWGDDPATCSRAVLSTSLVKGCGRSATWPVCALPDGNTEQGLCDMAGNVWQWTADWHHGSYEGAPADGSAWVNPPGTERVVRGGSWDRRARRVRTRSRISAFPSLALTTTGFRPVRSRR